MDLTFEPNGERGRYLYRRMCEELASSIEYLILELSGRKERPAVWLCQLTRDLKSEAAFQPLLFTGYYQAVMNIQSGDTCGLAALDGLKRFSDPLQSIQISNFDAVGMGDQASLDLTLLALDTDARLRFDFLPPTQTEADVTRQSIYNAMALMRVTCPELAGEFESIVRQIILASGSREDGASRFDGASSYMLWGALAISVNRQRSDLEMLQVLTHESAHSFLFGLTIDEPLVKNSDNDLFSSPLRDDKRPMDGVYHATFVAARMYYAIDEAIKSGLLTDVQMHESEALLASSKQAFFDGYQVVDAFGDLSESGHQIMANTLAYMNTTTPQVVEMR